MIELPPLPYSQDGLEPVMSARTLQIHHDRHHARYVEVVNQMTGELAWPAFSLERLISRAGEEANSKLLQNAVQAWNHAFFWNSMTPDRTAPDGVLAEAIEAAEGGPAGLKAAFLKAGAGHFGSGWVWLVVKDGAISVLQTHDGDPRKAGDGTPLLVCDVWEHAYYLDHQNDRAAYLEGWWDRLANWRFAGTQIEAAMSGRPGWAYADGTSRPEDES